MSYANMDGVPAQTPGVSELLASDWNTYVKDNFDSIKFGHVVVASSAALPSAAEGTMAYVTDSNKIFVYNGSAWCEIFDLDNVATVSGVPTLRGVPVGVIEAFAGATAPAGWLLCDGSAVSQTTYADLFGVISTTYNTSAGNTAPSAGLFRVPDLRGRTIIGVGTGNSLSARSLADSVGDERLQAHTHTFTTSTIGNHSHNVYFRYIDYYGTSNYSPAGNAGQYGFGSGVQSGDAGSHNHTGTTDAHNQSQGSGQNMQPSLAVNYIIKY